MHEWLNWCGVITLLASQQSVAADLQINIVGDSKEGEVSCGLFTSAEGFPASPKLDHRQVAPAGQSTICLFRDLQPGNYAVSVMSDMNRNGKLDKNLFGVPKEPWGVSNNVRPSLRAPKFEEALISVNTDTAITVRIDK